MFVMVCMDMLPTSLNDFPVETKTSVDASTPKQKNSQIPIWKSLIQLAMP